MESPLRPVLIALLLLAALLAALGLLPSAARFRTGVGLLLLGIALAIVGPLLGPERLELAGLRVGLDGLSGFALIPALIASVPPLLREPRRAGPAAACVIVAILGDGVLAVLALATLVLLSSPRTLPLALWALCASLALAVPETGGLLTPGRAVLAGVGLGALWFGAADPVVAVTAVYVLARTALGTPLSVSLGLSLLALGLLGAGLGATRAAAADAIDAALPGFAAFATGLATAGLGVAVAARGADLLPVASLGLTAGLFGLLAQSVAIAAFALAAASVRDATGTGALARLGGLWRSMPGTGLCALIAGASLGGIPPAPGFTGVYLLLRSLFAANRIGGVGGPFVLAVAAAAVGLAAGLAGLASLRLIGTAFLGRQGERRGADPRGDLRTGMAVLAGLVLVFAVAPPLVLLLARPALVGAGLPVEPINLAPTAITLLIILACGLASLLVRAAPGSRRVPAWEDGLPPGSITAPYVPGRLAALQWRPRPRLPTLRECLGAAALALLIVLIAVATG